MASLQDQLLKAGVVNKGKAQKIHKDKQKQRKQKAPQGQTAEDPKQIAAKALEQKKQRDLERNKQLNAEAERKALQAQVTQWINNSLLEPDGGEVPFQFVHKKTIKKIYVSASMAEDLSKGQAAIVVTGKRYSTVPDAIGKKVLEALPERLVLMNDAAKNQLDPEDEYAQYQIPDDLMW